MPPTLGLGDQISGGGDLFYFQVLPGGADEAVLNAQTDLARTLIGKEAQLAFNLKRGSMPIRIDIDMAAANPCMQKALALFDTACSHPASSLCKATPSNSFRI